MTTSVPPNPYPGMLHVRHYGMLSEVYEYRDGAWQVLTDDRYDFNATGLNGHSAAYYLAAENLTGTVASERLSGEYNITIPAYNASIATINTELSTFETYLAVETAERVAGDNALQIALAAETNARLNATETIQASVGNEPVIRASADATLQANIDAEAVIRGDADNALQANIDAEIAIRSASAAGLQSNINDETAIRTSADNALQANIDAEAATRASADTTLQNNIDAESTSRTNADTTLQNNINAEAAARASADTTLQNNINTKLALSGGALTGTLTTAQVAAPMALGDGVSSLQVRGPTAGAGDTELAAIAFHIPSAYAVKLGLRGDGYFGLGGWSANPWRWFVQLSTGNMTAAGNVTAFSDARLKSDVETISDALSLVKAMRGVTFTKDGAPGVGVIAQEMREVLPQVVIETPNAEKTLSVAYGNIVGVLIEAVKELSAEVEALKGKV